MWAAAPQQLTLQTATDTFATAWWPWAAGIAGAVCILLALWWLLAHLPRRGVGELSLKGSDKSGRLLIDPAGAAATAADVLAETPGIRSASSRVVRDRGQLVVAVKATRRTRRRPAVGGHRHRRRRDRPGSVLGRDDARARVQLSVARRARHRTRVH